MTVQPHPDRTEPQPPAALIEQAIAEITQLFRKEMDLARAEVGTNLKLAAFGIGLVLISALLTLTALHVLAGALVAALATGAGISPGLSALIVGLMFILIAACLAVIGLRSLRLRALAPTRTAENLKEDVKTLKEAYDA